MDNLQKQHKNLLERIDYIESKEKSLRNRTIAAEEKLNTRLISEVLLKLQTDKAGKVLNTASNVILLSQIDKIYSKISDVELSSLVKFLKTSLQHLVRMNEIYFEISTSKKKVKPNAAIVKTQINQFLGIRKTGRLRQGGLLSIIQEDRTVSSKIYKTLFNSVISGTTLVDVQKQLKDVVTGGENLGAITKMINVGTNDLYSSIDRAASSQIGNRLKMTASIYTGNKISSTRPFCGGGRDEKAGTFSKKIGQVFLDEEIKGWESIRKFEGKNRNYNAKVHLGGHNCRHSLGYIDDFTAMALRKDLEIVGGILKAKKVRFKKW